MAKANKDGWIRHRGGKCPVEEGTLVDVRFRDGHIARKFKALTWESEDKVRCARDWSSSQEGTAIMAWRLHKAEDAKPEESVKETEVKEQRATEASYLVVAAKQGVELAEHLLARYLATFEEKKALEVTIAARQNDIAMIEKEQEELREKVRALGFDFYDAPKVEEDMSNQNNWRVGDVIACVDPDVGDVGELATITSIRGGVIYKKRASGHESNHSIGSKYWEFHSRPK